jgi:hypothetical protein
MPIPSSTSATAPTYARSVTNAVAITGRASARLWGATKQQLGVEITLLVLTEIVRLELVDRSVKPLLEKP